MTVRTVAVAMTLGAAFGAGGMAAQAQDEPFRLVITETETPLVINSVMILAEELGYFDAEGVDVELIRVTDTPLAFDVLANGDGDMANIALDAVLLAVANDVLDLRAVTSPDRFLPFLIASKDTLTDADDLEGSNFGVARVGSLDYGLSSMVMTAQGVDPDSVNWIAIGPPPARAESLANGDIDATTMSIGVWLSMPDHSGLHILVGVEAFGAAAPVVNKVNVVTAETLANRRDDIEAVIRALISLSREFNANPAAWVEAMLVSRPDQSRENLEALAAQFTGSWSVNGGLNADELNFSVGQIFAGEDFAELTAPALGDWVDTSVIDSILTELGVDDSADAPGR
ncbi:MAG: ABC transporter substrate-binding protein [Bauldia sp.]|nr:ABC transporter substrate-binding protein [Bauldia sp.]